MNFSKLTLIYSLYFSSSREWKIRWAQGILLNFSTTLSVCWNCEKIITNETVAMTVKISLEIKIV